MTKKNFIFITIITSLSSCGPFTLFEPGQGQNSRNLASTNKDVDQCQHDFYEDQKILYIGDSHSYLSSENGERMGNELIDQFAQCGAHSISYHGVCGSRPRNWMPGSTPRSTCGVSIIDAKGFRTSNKGSSKNIEVLQKEENPHIVVINLGDNMFSWKRQRGKTVASITSVKKVSSEVKKLVQQLHPETRCQWIGPVYHDPGKPYYKPDAMVDKLYKAISIGLSDRCTLIDSRGFFEKTRPNDGLHLTSSESKHWGLKLSEAIRNIE